MRSRIKRLGKMVVLQNMLKTTGRKLSLHNVGPLIYEVFEVTRLSKICDGTWNNLALAFAALCRTMLFTNGAKGILVGSGIIEFASRRMTR